MLNDVIMDDNTRHPADLDEVAHVVDTVLAEQPIPHCIVDVE